MNKTEITHFRKKKQILLKFAIFHISLLRRLSGITERKKMIFCRFNTNENLNSRLKKIAPKKIRKIIKNINQTKNINKSMYKVKK